MDNPLTPKRIQRLITLAEGKSFNPEKVLYSKEDSRPSRIASQTEPPKYHYGPKVSDAQRESSSGIIDLDRVEGFGESGLLDNISLSRSTAFNPGEMTGRSTETIDCATTTEVSDPQFGRHSIALDALASKMDKQTNEINDIMRHSIATNYTFNSKRDLTADEISLINREAPLPVLQTTRTYFTDTMSTNNTSNVSVGTYFQNRCVDFTKILGRTDSPDRSMMPSISEVSASAFYDHGMNQFKMTDDALDSVPVRQPKNTDNQTISNQDKNEPQTTNFQKSLNQRYEKVLQAKNADLEQKRKMDQDTFIVPENSSRMRPMNEIVQEQSRMLEKPLQMRAMNPPTQTPQKYLKPTDMILKNLHASFKVPTDDTTECETENSLSISKIADYLRKQSDVSVTDMLQLQQKHTSKKQPLTELHLNTQTNKQVTNLAESKKAETASSAGTVDTVINLKQLTVIEEEPKRSTRSKSPSSRSLSTLTTVRDNNNSNRSSGFRSNESGNCTKEGNRSKVPSPNITYKELDKSVDWQEILLQNQIRQRAIAKVSEQWVEIEAKPVVGFVGVNTVVTIKGTTLADSWLTAKLEFDSLPNDGKDLNIEVPRLPLLLSPGKSENFTVYISCNVEMDTILPFTLFIKDASLDGDVEQKGELPVSFKIPVVQAMSSDGMNKLTYPPIVEHSSITKIFILISDCPSDLQLKLSLNEGDPNFCIKSIQEVKKTEVNTVLLEHQASDETKDVKKSKPSNKQLCRLVTDCAIRVSITFNAPQFTIDDPTITKSFTSALLVTLMGSNTILKKVDLIASVGTPNLTCNVPENKIQVSSEGTSVTVINNGTVAGNWSVTYRAVETGCFPFSVTPTRFQLESGESINIDLAYTGQPDGFYEGLIRFEESPTGKTLDMTLVGGNEKLKTFPIKTNAQTMSWVRASRKEVSLKNTLDTKVHIRCQIVGDGFFIDLPGWDNRGIYVLTFNANECRPLPIIFKPASGVPHTATLHLAQEKSLQQSRKIKMFGCAGGELVRWSGLVTYSETAALVRASVKAPVDLKLHNKAVMPAFVATKVNFNLQYKQIASYCRIKGANKIMPGRSSHTISLWLDWPRVESRAREAATTALATVTVLTGSESTRRRILKILKRDSKGQQIDLSLLPDNLKVLAERFDGEDSTMDKSFADFDESKTSLNELISGIQELTAHIDLPQDFTEENTIIISDDTIVTEHHTFINE